MVARDRALGAHGVWLGVAGAPNLAGRDCDLESFQALIERLGDSSNYSPGRVPGWAWR